MIHVFWLSISNIECTMSDPFITTITVHQVICIWNIIFLNHIIVIYSPAQTIMVHVNLESIFDNDIFVHLKVWSSFETTSMLEQVQNTVVLDSWDALQLLEQMPLEQQDEWLCDHYSKTVNELVNGHQLVAQGDKIKYFGAFKGQKNPKNLDMLFGQAVCVQYKIIKPTITSIHVMVPKELPSGKTLTDVFDDIKHNYSLHT